MGAKVGRDSSSTPQREEGSLEPCPDGKVMGETRTQARQHAANKTAIEHNCDGIIVTEFEKRDFSSIDQ